MKEISSHERVTKVICAFSAKVILDSFEFPAQTPLVAKTDICFIFPIVIKRSHRRNEMRISFKTFMFGMTFEVNVDLRILSNLRVLVW